MSGAIATLHVHVDAMRRAAEDPLLLATDLAEILVREGVPFREAHEAVGKLVGHCVSNRVDARTLSAADLRAFHPAFPGGAAELVDLERSIESRDLVGGPARARVLAALDATEERLREEEEVLDALESESGGATKP